MIRLEMTAVARAFTTPPASCEDASVVDATAAVDTATGEVAAPPGAVDSWQALESAAEPARMMSGMVFFT
jgi:hypothetical protein